MNFTYKFYIINIILNIMNYINIQLNILKENDYKK